MEARAPMIQPTPMSQPLKPQHRYKACNDPGWHPSWEKMDTTILLEVGALPWDKANSVLDQIYDIGFYIHEELYCWPENS